MDDLKPYAVLAETVRLGSMSAAARRLGMSPSAVSQTIRALERQAGVTLLHRSTRKLSLTEAGERCYPHCRRLLDSAEAAADALPQARDTPAGELRVAAPVGFATHIPVALAPLLARSRGLRLALLMGDAPIDPIDARVDIAVRVGHLADASAVARRLCQLDVALCAAPGYVGRRGAPTAPDDLAGHDWLVLTHGIAARTAAERIPALQLDLFDAAGRPQRVRAGARIASNNMVSLQRLCEQGLGLACLPQADALPALDRGALVRLLPQWRAVPLPVSAVTLRRDGQPAKVRLALQALQRYFAALPGASASAKRGRRAVAVRPRVAAPAAVVDQHPEPADDRDQRHQHPPRRAAAVVPALGRHRGHGPCQQQIDEPVDAVGADAGDVEQRAQQQRQTDHHHHAPEPERAPVDAPARVQQHAQRWDIVVVVGHGGIVVAVMTTDLIVQRPEGLYCPPGDFHIDPWQPVARAVVTHAHADHARRGHGAYLGSAISAGVLKSRLGDDITLQTADYGEAVWINGVRVSLHPAGHVLGSAQVRVEHAGQVWVASGDYFVSGASVDGASGTVADTNATCAPFEPQRCHCFISECTFGLPIYRWRPQREVLSEIDAWWRGNADAGRPSLLLGYSFGKAQRLIAGVDASIGPIVVHGAVEPLNAAYRAAGVALPSTLLLDDVKEKALLQRALVVAPPALLGSKWARRLGDHGDAFASGWMQLRGARRRQGVDRGFVLSDHADWPGLQRAITATGAERVILTHGYEAVMVRWLQQQGLEAGSFATEYGDDAVEADAT